MTIVVLIWLQLVSSLLNHLMSSRMIAMVAGLTAVSIGAFVMLTIIAKKRVLIEKNGIYCRLDVEWLFTNFG